MTKIELSIDVTYKCPFSCPFCSSPNSDFFKDMNLYTARKCLNYLEKVKKSKTTQPLITITGGEPLTLSTLPSLVSEWAQHNSIIRMCTSAGISVGTKYWNNLYSKGLRTIFLSLHCTSDKKCKRIFGWQYKFQTVAKNVEWIKEAGITLYVNFVLTKMSINCFDELLDYCVEREIKKIRILGLAKQGKAFSNWERITLSKEGEKIFIKHASTLSKNYPVKLEFAGLPNYKSCTHMDNKRRCLGGISFFHINTNGDIYPCPSVKSIKSAKIGSVFHFQKVSEHKGFPCNEDFMSKNLRNRQLNQSGSILDSKAGKYIHVKEHKIHRFFRCK